MSNPIKINDYIDTISKAEDIINYKFENKELLLKALTHPSAVQGNSVEYSYQRLEFLGDSLLGAAVASAIFRDSKDLNEGKMTHMKAAMVSGEILSEVAKNLGFSELIIFGKSEKNTGRRGMASALEDVYEAIVAAVFLDGGPVQCWKFVNKTMLSNNLCNKELSNKDNPKSILQEKIQTYHKTPEYYIVKESGPAHNKTFYVDVTVSGKVLAQGVGHSKKEAEANAAQKALDKYEKLYGDL